MTDQQQQPRPPMWRVMFDTPMPEHVTMPEQFAAYIRAVAQYLPANGLVNPGPGKTTPGSGARLLAALEEEAQRAEAAD